MTLTWSHALAWRMRQHLLEPISNVSAEDVVKRLCAVPASAAELTIRARQAQSRPGEVERAIADGHLIKTFAFRGAIHLMTPEDAGIYLALRASSRMWELSSWQRYYKLKPADWPDLRKAVRDALANGPITGDELIATVTARHHFKHLSKTFTKTLLKPLTWLGEMSFGPPRDGHTTFQRLDSNPRWAGIPELDLAGPKAIGDYFRAYGPATAKHLRYWLGESLGAGKFLPAWFASLKDRFASVDIDGSEAFVLHEDFDVLMSTPISNAVRLLPAYDQWVMGPGTSDANLVPKKVRTQISRGANIVIFGGVVAGTWSVVDEMLSIVWFDKRKAPKEILTAEVERFTKILELPLKWKIERQ